MGVLISRRSGQLPAPLRACGCQACTWRSLIDVPHCSRACRTSSTLSWVRFDTSVSECEQWPTCRGAGRESRHQAGARARVPCQHAASAAVKRRGETAISSGGRAGRLPRASMHHLFDVAGEDFRERVGRRLCHGIEAHGLGHLRCDRAACVVREGLHPSQASTAMPKKKRMRYLAPKTKTKRRRQGVQIQSRTAG